MNRANGIGPSSSILARIIPASGFAPCGTAHILTKRGAGATRSPVMEKNQLTPKPKKLARLDLALVERGLCESREKAKRAVMAGQALVNGQRAAKASDKVKPSDEVTLAATDKFVSRGGYKLEHALETFGVEAAGLRAIDLGASTGGFTDCLLQHGAAMVAAVDVGQGQLAWALRNDERVHVMERTNARHLTPASFPQPFEPFDLAVVDCSFISLRQILPATVDLLPPGGQVVMLVKPQFEAGKAEADKGQGVIRDPQVHRHVLDELRAFVSDEPTLEWVAEIESPLTGPAGNKEFLVLLNR
uniref:Predicted rRNA methylase n=1 Tax=uncultured Verrucomicrobiales bacterium HF0200_39L05 TaxID=710997 RepID=E0XUQ4_9BACT|nr:predicted rRNA methylase [uncultured Verrucomicrobiales bacterium HF0200_39L05]